MMKPISKNILVKVGYRERTVTFTKVCKTFYTVECRGKRSIEIEKTKEGWVGSIRSDSFFLVKTNPKEHPGLAFEVLVRDFWSK